MNPPIFSRRASVSVNRALSLAFVWLLCWSGPDLHAISLTGSNGKAVEFHTLLSATPKGLTAQVVADGPILGIPWEKLDLAALERDQKQIHDAYLRAIQGETVDLKIGPEKMNEPAAGAGAKAPAEEQARYPGWLDLRIGKMEFMLQLPPKEPRGILIVSLSSYGRSFEWLFNHQRGTGVWGVFQTQNDFALLTYNIDEGNQNFDPTQIQDFVYAEKSSGKVFESAINQFAAKTKNPKFADLPIALYGAERTGAAFVYNFVHYKPERILAAVVSKGAFYDAAPTAESAKVPMLFIWGEYSNDHERWKSENYAETVLAKAAPLSPNWTNAPEFRGDNELNEVVDFLGKKYLSDIIATRLPKTDASDAAPAVVALDRSKGFRGNLKTGEILKITDPTAPLGADETFLPSDAFGKLWKEYIVGKLEVPER